MPINLEDGLLGYWKLNNGSGSNVSDSGSGGNPGVCREAGTGVWPGATVNGDWVAGPIQSALRFNGEGDYGVYIPYNSGLSLTGPVSVAAWVKLTDASTTRAIFHKQDGEQGGIAMHAVSGGYPQFDIMVSQVVGPDPLPLGQWAHMVGVYDESELILYVNGQEVARESAGTLTATTAHVGIGLSIPGYWWAGDIAEVRLYNRVLSPTEIALLGNPAGVNAPYLSSPVAVDQDCTSSRCSNGCGLPTWRVTPMNQNLTVQDSPFFYQPGKGPAVQLLLSYNVAGDSDLATLFGADKLPFGPGFTHNYGSFIEWVEGDEALAIVRMPDLRTDTYIVDEGDDTIYHPQDGLGVFNELTKPDANTFLLTLKDRTVLKFEYLGFDLTNDNKCFALKEIIDPNGFSKTLDYDATDKWKLLSITDALDQETTFAWTTSEGQNRVSAIVNDELELSAEFGYDDEHRLNSITDQADFTSTLAYDDAEVVPPILTAIMLPKTSPKPTVQFGYEESETEEPSRRISSVRMTDEAVWQYLSEGNNRVIVNPLGRRTTYVLNEFGGSEQIINAAGKITYQVYDENRLLQRVIDPDLRTTDRFYDEDGMSEPNRGNLTTEKRYKELYPGDPAQIGTDADMSEVEAVVRTWKYNETDLVTEATDAKGTVKYEYENEDFPNNPTKITDRLNHDTLIEYVDPEEDGAGKPAVVTDREENEWDFGYNEAGNLTSQKDPLENETTHDYDERGRRISTTNALSQTTGFEYDNLNRLLKTIFPDTTFIQRIFNCCEELEIIDQASKHWRKIYDPTVAGRVRMEIDPMGRVIVYNYDLAGQLISLADPKGAIWWFVYDELGRVVMQIDPLFRTRKFTYDNTGHVLSRTDEKGNVTNYTYDALGRLVTVSYPDGKQVIYTYDDVGNRLTMQDSTGNWEWQYDAESRMTSAKSPQADEPTLFEYDNEGHRTKLTDPDGNAIDYAYDDAYRLLTLTASADPDPLEWSFSPDELGRTTHRVMPNGITTDYHYNDMGRLDTVTHKDSEENLLLSFAYEFDALGNRTKVTRGVGGGVTMPSDFGDGSFTEYGYDLTGQLTGEKYYNPTPELFREHNYEYDLAGNRVKKTTVVGEDEGTELMSYDVANQILKRIRSGDFENDTTLFEHDANGNLTKETIQGTPDIVKNLGYNFENNMVSFQRVEEATETNLFRYSADGLRVEKTAPDQELSKFLLDGVAVELQKASTVAEDLKSFSFDGDTSINYGSCPDFTSAGGLSVSAWVEDVNEAAGYLTGFLLLGGTNIGADSNFGGLFVDIAGVVSYFSSQSIASGKHHIYLRYDGSGSFADPHMELYLDGEKVTLTPNTGGTTPNFSGDLKVGTAQSDFEGLLDQLAIWDADKGAGDFLEALYNGGDGRVIANDEEDLVLLAPFNEDYEDKTGNFSSPSLSGTETYDDPLVMDERGPFEPKARFIPGSAMINAEGDVSYYLEDALGSVMALADDEGIVTGVYQYDAWGNALVEPENDANPYRWRGIWGYYWDTNMEIYLLGLRWCDPRIGRFITQDPIGFNGGDANLFRYSQNRPVDWADPSGLITYADAECEEVGRWVNPTGQLCCQYECKCPPGYQRGFDRHRINGPCDNPPTGLKCFKLDRRDYSPALDPHVLPNRVPVPAPKPIALKTAPSSGPGINWWLIGAGALVILGTLAEDVLTLGGGVLDDPATLGAGAALIRAGFR
jgi:RHS repeat-associated protein